MININGHTKQLAILGYPVEHSFSPQMHTFISEQMGLNYIYTALEVEPQNLEDAIKGVRAMNIAGLNITAPHKNAVMKYLDVISDEAQKFNSVNTVVNRDGKLYGYNTDAHGFYHSLLHNGITVKDKDILILGAGGASRPVAMLLAMEGAKSVTVVNRTKEKAVALAEYVKDVIGFAIQTEKTLNHYDVVINTTSAGMAPQLDKCPIEDMSFIDENTAAADMIYNPEKTLFLQRAEQNGAKIMNGLGMLIYQGLIAYEHFTGVKLPDDMYDKVAKEVFGR